MSKKHKDKDPDDYCKGGILTNRAVDFIVTCVSSFLECYELLNHDARITFEKREKAIKRSWKGVDRIDEGKLKKELNMDELEKYAPMLEQDALNYSKSLEKKAEEMELGGFYG